jgi:hypothetical protein
MARYREKHRLEIADVMRPFRTGHFTALWLQSGGEAWGTFCVRTRTTVAAHLFAVRFETF